MGQDQSTGEPRRVDFVERRVVVEFHPRTLVGVNGWPDLSFGHFVLYFQVGEDALDEFHGVGMAQDVVALLGARGRVGDDVDRDAARSLGISLGQQYKYEQDDQ